MIKICASSVYSTDGINMFDFFRKRQQPKQQFKLVIREYSLATTRRPPADPYIDTEVKIVLINENGEENILGTTVGYGDRISAMVEAEKFANEQAKFFNIPVSPVTEIYRAEIRPVAKEIPEWKRAN